MIKLLVCWSKLSDDIEEMQDKLLKTVVGLSGRNDPFECKCPFCFRSYQTQDQFGQYHIVFNYICFLSFVLCLFYISGLFWYFSSSFFSTILSDSILFVLINVTYTSVDICVDIYNICTTVQRYLLDGLSCSSLQKKLMESLLLGLHQIWHLPSSILFN